MAYFADRIDPLALHLAGGARRADADFSSAAHS
jgi:hypothetical protein